MKRLGIPPETPCAVQQWEGLIAVNYPARARGVTRHMRVKEAKKICPELVLVHVETIGAAGSSEGGADTDAAAAAAAAAEAGGGGAAPATAGAPAGSSGGGNGNRRLTQKACLERYRRSTAEVLVLLHRLAPGCTIEKASIDEVYMDVTGMVGQEVTQSRTGAGSAVDAFGWNSIVIGGPLDPASEVERRLAAGAGIACRLRGALREQMGYNASAGIATNKLLAKIGSAMHKPNQQTVIPPRSVPQDLPLSKLRGFGGKLGEQLEALGCTTAGQVQQLPRATLVSRFGAERAAGIEEAVRGVSHEAVQEKERPKSMLAAKSFNPTSDLAALEGWFKVLAQELAARMAADEAQFRRRPKNLVVHYRGGPGASSERSKSCAMPRSAGGSVPSAALIAEAAFNLFKTKCAGEALPCSRLAISAADFTDLPAAGSSAITRFFAPKAAGAAGEAAGGAAGGAAGEAATAAGGGVEHDRAAPQQQQQQAAGAGKGPAGASVSKLFQRAEKRQRLETQQQQQQQPAGWPNPADAPQAASGTAGGGSQAPAAAGSGVAVGGVADPPRPTAGTSGVGAAAAEAAPAAQADASNPAAAANAPAAGKRLAAVDAAAGERAAAAADAAAETEDPAAAADAAALAGVDIEEQRRILRDIAMFQRLAQRGTSAGGSGSNSSSAGKGGGSGGGRGKGRAGGGSRGKGGGTGGSKQQPGISAFFAKQQQGGSGGGN
ncbi:hypothetical protein COHA_003144 [Chlorella ohadii]|uniref:DNA polymerase eta n=1 Tax=Chlorella ohadii TaxID=2649997 RepID=A0AAD5DSJ2_9CHLO|nr:hypothetical protein COHA_003144 [Chlorella ohadii]